MAVTKSNIFHHHLLFIGNTGRNIKSRPEEAVESDKIWYMMRNSTCHGCVFSVLLQMLVPNARIISRACDLSEPHILKPTKVNLVSIKDGREGFILMYLFFPMTTKKTGRQTCYSLHAIYRWKYDSVVGLAEDHCWLDWRPVVAGSKDWPDTVGMKEIYVFVLKFKLQSSGCHIMKEIQHIFQMLAINLQAILLLIYYHFDLKQIEIPQPATIIISISSKA